MICCQAWWHMTTMNMVGGCQITGQCFLCCQMSRWHFQWSLHTVNNWTTLHMPVTRSMERNQCEPQFQVETRMAPAFTEWETMVFDYKKCKQRGKSESCSDEEYELSQSPQEARWMPTSTNGKGWAGSSGPAAMQFDADPFDPPNPTLRSLQSGLLATLELVTDFRMALQDGKIEAETILHERGLTKTRSLTATIHRNKRRNFASEQIWVPPGASMNVIWWSGLVALVDLAEGAGMLKLE